jgi:hypothetical protein
MMGEVRVMTNLPYFPLEANNSGQKVRQLIADCRFERKSLLENN